MAGDRPNKMHVKFLALNIKRTSRFKKAGARGRQKALLKVVIYRYWLF